jgi:hypothetical protein
MKRPTAIALIIGGAAVAVAAVVIALAATLGRQTTLTFGARDAVSGKWVWDLTASLQGREIRSFFQSDAGPVAFRFSRLSPGKGMLSISAPAYRSVEIPVTLGRGDNRLPQPVEMQGLEIPGLDHFVIFENLDGSSNVVAQLRPVGTDGKAVLNHPCLPLWIGCRMAVEVKGGVPVREETETGTARGDELFRGKLDWQWDPAPETVFRYSARIPVSLIKDDPALYRVIDYLVVVPDPRKISASELDSLMERVWPLGDPAAIGRALDAEKGRLRYFTDTSWNVKGRQEQ